MVIVGLVGRNVALGLRECGAGNDHNSLLDSAAGGRWKNVGQGFRHVAADDCEIAIG